MDWERPIASGRWLPMATGCFRPEADLQVDSTAQGLIWLMDMRVKPARMYGATRSTKTLLIVDTEPGVRDPVRPAGMTPGDYNQVKSALQRRRFIAQACLSRRVDHAI
jgi:hypothetical protein